MQSLGFDVQVQDAPHGEACQVASDGQTVSLPRAVAYPTIEVFGHTYAVRVRDLGASGPPIVVVNSPQMILVNGANEMVVRLGVPSATRILLAMQVAEEMAGHGGQSGLDWARALLLRSDTDGEA